MDSDSDFNAVELEVFKQLLAAVAEEMGVRLMRSAFSPNIKERRDYSCALFDPRGDMIAQAAHIPVHLGSAPASVKAVLESFPLQKMLPGQRFIVNDPFAGGTHLPDITVVEPVFVEGQTTPKFFVANRAHHADVGGKSPGSMPIGTSIDGEGVRLAPSLLTEGLIDDFCEQTRTPDERRGDLRAQLASLDAGRDRLTQLCADHGSNRIAAAGEALQAYAARFIASLIGDTPDGVYRFEDAMDDDGHGHTDLAIRCTLTVAGDHATFDFRESDDQTLGPVNAVRAICLSAVLYALRCLAPADLPSNSGVLRPIKILTRPGSLVDALPPAAVAGGNVETSQRLVDVVFGALAQAMPNVVPAASCGTMNNLLIGSPPPPEALPETFRETPLPRGVSPQALVKKASSQTADLTAPPFAYYETIAGGAGGGPMASASDTACEKPSKGKRASKDVFRGGDALQTHMTNTLNTPVEALEHSYPFRIAVYAVREGSGGVGRCRGGDGVIRRYVFERPAVVTLLTERRTRRPYGLRGGGPGNLGRNRLIRADGSERVLPGKCTLEVVPGDQLEIQTPGGGGWGPA